MNKIIYITVSAVLFLAIWLFWWVGCPEMLSYHEQYQLFLFTGEYFTERLSVAGGLADYVSEFLVQFYYVPVLGAAMAALVLTALQALLGYYTVSICSNHNIKQALYILSALPSVLLLYYMGDENVLLSYPVALVLMLTATMLMRCLKGSVWIFAVVLLAAYTLLYWLIGPATLLFMILSIIQRPGLRLKWVWAALSIVAAYCITVAYAHTICVQYPYGQLMMGINYYRISNMHPTGLLIVAAVIIIIPLLRLYIKVKPVVATVTTAAAIALTAVLLVPTGYSREKLDIFRYDRMVRAGQWHEIIKAASEEAPTSDFCLQGLNLALAKTGQLGDRMFEWSQNGIGGLIAKRQLDNTTCLIAAETLYHLGMVNSAFRYNFDTQEAIMNDRKSGRFMKRMAECMIINGKYKVASKYIDMLKNSLYYRDWAKEAETYLNDEEAINQHPDWGEKRRIRFKQELFYDYNEIEKLLGLLAIESNGQNLLAWDYFNAALMLKGDLPTLCGMYHYAPETFHLTEIPKHIQEAIAMYWTLGHTSFDGLPYNISDDVKARITSLARVYGQNPNNPSAWAPQYDDTYWVYFLQRQTQNNNQPKAEEHSGSVREG